MRCSARWTNLFFVEAPFGLVRQRTIKSYHHSPGQRARFRSRRTQGEIYALVGELHLLDAHGVGASKVDEVEPGCI